MTESWRAVPGFPAYQVSDHGRVRTLNDRPGSRAGDGIMSPGHLPRGHLRVALRRDGKRCDRQVHALVLLAFVGPCPEGMEALHKDDDPSNNALTNLRWGTHTENMADARRNGRLRAVSPERRAIVLAAVDGGSSVRDAARAHGVSWRAVYDWLAERRSVLA